MRKTPHVLLMLAALASFGARAAETDSASNATREDKPVVVAVNDNSEIAQGTAAPAATPAPAPKTAAPPPAAKVEAKADDKKKEEEAKDKFPLHASIGFDNGLGQGIFQARGEGRSIPVQGGPSPTLQFPATQPEVQLSTSMSLSGNASLPKIDGVPKIGVSTGVSISMPNWIPSYGNTSAFERELQVSDINDGASMGKAFTEEFTKISASPRLGLRIPISLGSRQRKVITAVSTGVGFGWSSGEADWGTIGVNYNPGLSFNLYYGDAPTARNAVGDANVGNGVPTDPITGQILPLAYCRTTEALAATGECELAGRRGVASLTNSVGVSYSIGNHGVSIGMGFSHGFLAPTSTRPELSSPFSSQQNFSESSNGSIGYSYDVPKDLTGPANVSLSVGLGSGGSAWYTSCRSDVGSGVPQECPAGEGDGSQKLRFPFWNFGTPGTNMSSASFGVSVGI